MMAMKRLGRNCLISFTVMMFSLGCSCSGGSDMTKKEISVPTHAAVPKKQTTRFSAVESAATPKIRVLNGDSIILSDVARYNFFDQECSAQSAPVVFTVRNEGGNDLIVTSINFIEGDARQFTLETPRCPAVIPPKGLVQFSAFFKPLTEGKKDVRVCIKSDDEVFSAFNFVMTGKGI